MERPSPMLMILKRALPEFDNGLGANAVHEESTEIGAVVATNSWKKEIM